jgi:hypothetical protein
LSEETTPAATESVEAPSLAPQLSLEERVAYLEAQNQGLKRVGGLALLLLLIVGGLLVNKNQSDFTGSVSRNYTLVKDDNEVSAALTSDAQGRVQFVQAKYGTMAGMQELPPGFQGYAFYDTAGQPLVLIGKNQAQETVFLVVDVNRQLTFNPFQGAPSAPATPMPGLPPTQPTPGPGRLTATPMPRPSATP